MKEKIQKILPPFVRIPLFCLVAVNFLAYYGTKLVTQNAKHYDLTIQLDLLIPFVTFFVSFYVLAYLQWIFSYTFHSKQSEEQCYTLVTANILAKIIASLFFIFLPTETQLPEVSGNGIWDMLTQLIYYLDTPRTLFPSLHCVESWLCFRSAMCVKTMPKWYAPAQGILSVLVFASTVLIKQHFIVDIFAGIAVAEIGWQIAKRKHFGAIFQKMNKVWHKAT